MSSFRGDFGHFYPLGDDDVETAIRLGLVTPDTNVLLALYRFQGKAREQLFGALEKLENRLWVPHQVGLEFHRNRLDAIEGQVNYLKSARKDLDRLIKDLRDTTGKFSARIGLDKERVDGMSAAITELQKGLTAEIIAAQKANIRLSNHASDPVLERLEGLLDDRVGQRMKPKALRAARKEARRRVAERIPPGFEDAGKADPTGDYLIFRQLMNKAHTRKLPVVFITDDEKRDWYWRKGDLVLGARHELREEMMIEAGVQFVIMTTADFLLNAQNYLEAEVSPETVDQAKELPNIVENEGYLKTSARLPEGYPKNFLLPSTLPEGFFKNFIVPSTLPEGFFNTSWVPSTLPKGFFNTWAPSTLPEGIVNGVFPASSYAGEASAESADDEDESHFADDDNDENSDSDD